MKENATIETLINQGHYFEARSKAEYLMKESDDLRLKQLYALALSKSGVPEAALEFMEPVYAQFPDDSESAGIMGSICKELFKKNQSNQFALRARDTYQKNFYFTRSYYTGINAASMSAMAGQLSRSREIATEVISILESRPPDFWTLATMGEAHILIKNKAKAIDYYIQARKEAGMDWGKITSVHNQLWLLNHFVMVPNEILKLFSPPKVAAFVGHMIDHPDRSVPRFPLAIEQKVKEAIVHSIQSLNIQIGYCSLACGGDILFAEAMAEEEREINILLPFEKSEYIKTSVAFAGENWVQRFEALANQFPVTYISNEPYEGLNDIFPFQTKIAFGAATLRSTSYHDEPTLLSVLSEVDLERKEGGTRHTTRLWPFPKNHLNVNPDIFLSHDVVKSVSSQSKNEENNSPVRPVLYAAYIDLSESASIDPKKLVNYHVEGEEDGTSYLIDDSENSSVLAAFNTESALIEYLRFVIESSKSFRKQATYKISVHAGPVYVTTNEANEKQLSGKTIDKLKEIGEINISGAILATESFAALLALKGKLFTVEYAGIFTLPGSQQKETIYKISFNSAMSNIGFKE